MPLILIKMLLPVAIQMIKVYIESTDSKQDDKVLDIVKEGAKYLSAKNNNSLTSNASYVVSKAIIRQYEK